MKPYWAKKETYEFFNEFLQNCILENKTLLLINPKDLFTLQNIESTCQEIKSYGDSYLQQLKLSPNEYSKVILVHALWFWAFVDTRRSNKYNPLEGDAYIKSDRLNIKYNTDTGIGSTGQYFMGNKKDEISSFINNIKDFKEFNCESLDDLKNAIVDFCKREKGDKVTKSMANILLHLCAPDNYEPIASDEHKNAIRSSLKMFMPKGQSFSTNIDEDILDIRKGMSIYFKNQWIAENPDAPEFTFYDKYIRDAWGYSEYKSFDADLINPISLLEYKKAMILYGPPGTSKTFDAKYYAKELITRACFKQTNILENFLKQAEPKEVFQTNIAIIQFHINYTYDDFVAGMQLQNGNSFAQHGYIFEVIQKAKNSPNIPFVLILDEINRTDISRVFGEVFSAMEYRNRPIKTAIGNFELTIPNNLYFIGTMNEIDFSLEHMDFALRRRFVWEFKGFRKDRLKDIIHSKDKELKTAISPNDIDDFVRRCENLNSIIDNEPSLGNNYEIGHTFFAEIVTIYHQILTSYNRQNIADARQILWRISIKPTLEAYCGNMGKEFENQFIDKCNTAFNN